MELDGARHPRQTIRLKGFDYSTPGAYFLTLCTQGKELRFGEIEENRMCPNAAGKMVSNWWSELAHKFPAIRVDIYVIMPNHLHGILILSNVPVGTDLCVRPTPLLPNSQILTLSRVVQWFKTMTTNEYFRRVELNGWPQLAGKLWQRNYYKHIIRHPNALIKIRQYIAENPQKWAFDVDNPTRHASTRDEITDIIAPDSDNIP